jgi:hypothetical protein
MASGGDLRIASFGANPFIDYIYALIQSYLDGGGLRAYSQLVMMDNFMYQLNYRRDPMLPYQYFDLIGGSDTGG